MKRLISFMLSAAMVFGMLPISALADELGVESAEAPEQSAQWDADQDSGEAQSTETITETQDDADEVQAPSAPQEQTVQDEGDGTDDLTQVQGNADAMLQDETAATSNDAASVLTANDFYVLLETASLLDEEAAVSLAAVARDGVRLVGGVTVNQAQLEALQSASTAGAYPLTFYAGEDYVTVYGAVNAEATSTQTGGNVTVKINEYDEIQGWINGDVKDVEITVDFEDITSADKSVSVTLPEGLKYMKYPVAATDSNNSSALQLVDNTIFKEFVTGIESYPEKTDHGYDYGSFNGTLAYTFRESTEKITFTIKVAVDESVYYGPKTFDSDETIVVEASKAGGVLNKPSGGI